MISARRGLQCFVLCVYQRFIITSDFHCVFFSDFSIKIFNDHLYFYDDTDHYIESFNLNSGPASMARFGPKNFVSISSLAVFSLSNQNVGIGELIYHVFYFRSLCIIDNGASRRRTTYACFRARRANRSTTSMCLGEPAPLWWFYS